MLNYETLMLVRTEITDDELSALEKYFDKVILGIKGRMTLFDKWGKYKLTYPVQKNVYGIYILSRYEIPSEEAKKFFKELDTLFRIKYNEVVMRHVNIRLEGEMSSIYKRPEAIGSHGGTSNLNSFIKENKMEGLIDTRVSDRGGSGKETRKKAKVESEEKVSAKQPKVEE